MKYSRLDIVKEIILFILITAFIFGWWMLMLLIISFMTSSYIHFTIEGMFVTSVVCAFVTDIIYIIKKVKEYRKRSAV